MKVLDRLLLLAESSHCLHHAVVLVMVYPMSEAENFYGGQFINLEIGRIEIYFHVDKSSIVFNESKLMNNND